MTKQFFYYPTMFERFCEWIDKRNTKKKIKKGKRRIKNEASN